MSIGFSVNLNALPLLVPHVFFKYMYFNYKYLYINYYNLLYGVQLDVCSSTSYSQSRSVSHKLNAGEILNV